MALDLYIMENPLKALLFDTLPSSVINFFENRPFTSTKAVVVTNSAFISYSIRTFYREEVTSFLKLENYLNSSRIELVEEYLPILGGCIGNALKYNLREIPVKGNFAFKADKLFLGSLNGAAYELLNNQEIENPWIYSLAASSIEVAETILGKAMKNEWETMGAAIIKTLIISGFIAIIANFVYRPLLDVKKAWLGNDFSASHVDEDFPAICDSNYDFCDNNQFCLLSDQFYLNT